MEDISLQVGRNLRKLRQQRGFSLDKLAQVTGVSKAMLGQIERGESNPTVTTLWKIANGLKISFSSLVENEDKNVSIVHKDTVTPLAEEEGQYRVYPFFPYRLHKQYEVYRIELDPQAEHQSEAHHEGVEEYILLNEGELELWIAEDVYTVQAGGAIHFLADVPHRYVNRSSTLVSFYLLIHYPS